MTPAEQLERPHRWIDQQADLDDVVDALIAEPAYAIDTEFHRERTYFPRLALVQLAWGDELVLIDPLAVDVKAMARLFESSTEAVFHAAQQDLDVLTHAVGAVPVNFFDTQIAGGFLGYGTPSLVAILNGELGVNPPKGDRLTDWLRRPLLRRAAEYAASDVAYLLELRSLLVAQLEELGRVEWVAEACAELRQRPASGTNPDEAWTRLKDVRGLRPRARAVAQSVAAWRERTAMRRNIPVRQVLPDLAVLGIAQRQPANEKELCRLAGSTSASAAASRRSRSSPRWRRASSPSRPTGRPGGDDLERDLRPAVTLVSAWVSQVARDERIDASILATRADLVAFLAATPTRASRTGGAGSCWARGSTV